MLTVDRPGVNNHLVRAGRLAQQFSASLSHIPAQHRMPILGHPDQVILAVPNGVAATLVHFHPGSLPAKAAIPYRLKAWGFLIPYRGL